MSHHDDNLYTILGKLAALQPRPEIKTSKEAAKKIYESVEARGSILSGVDAVQAKLAKQFAIEGDESKLKKGHCSDCDCSPCRCEKCNECGMLESKCQCKQDITEGAMSEIHMELSQVAQDEDYDKLYDLLGDSGPIGNFLQDMANDISVDHGLHLDDDLEKIMDRMMDRIQSNFGDDDDVAEGGKTPKQYWNRDSQSIGSTPDDGLTYADPDEDGVHYPDYGNTKFQQQAKPKPTPTQATSANNRLTDKQYAKQLHKHYASLYDTLRITFNRRKNIFSVAGNNGFETDYIKYRVDPTTNKLKMTSRISAENESVNPGVAEASYINGKEEDPKSLRWKQTSMTQQQAITKYGKENVRVARGGLRNGDDMVEVKVPLGEQGMAEGLVKDIKRSLAGWGAYDNDGPADVIKRVKGHDTDTLNSLSHRGSVIKGSPAELQQKAIRHELKKRSKPGVSEEVELDEGAWSKEMDKIEGKKGRWKDEVDKMEADKPKKKPQGADFAAERRKERLAKGVAEGGDSFQSQFDKKNAKVMKPANPVQFVKREINNNCERDGCAPGELNRNILAGIAQQSGLSLRDVLRIRNMMDPVMQQGVAEGETVVKGNVSTHKGTYGNEYQGDPDDDDGKPAPKAPKVSNSKTGKKGRPTGTGKNQQTTGRKYDHSALSSILGGSAPKNKVKGTVHKMDESMDQVARRLTEGVNLLELLKEKHQTVDEMLAELSTDIANFKESGHCSELLKDCMDIKGAHKKAEPFTALDIAPAHAITPDATRLPHEFNSRPMEMDRELNELARLAGLSEDCGDMPPIGIAMQDMQSEQDNLSISTTYNSRDGKKTISVNADGKQAEDLLQMLRIAGLGGGEKAQELQARPGIEFDNIDGEASTVPQDDLEELPVDIQMHQQDDAEMDEAEFDAPALEPVNGPKPEYKTMKQSTMGPGEGDGGEKAMHPDRPTNNNGDNALSTPATPPTRAQKTLIAVSTLESKLAAEYESIKKVN